MAILQDALPRTPGVQHDASPGRYALVPSGNQPRCGRQTVVQHGRRGREIVIQASLRSSYPAGGGGKE